MMPTTPISPWIYIPDPRPDAAVRLFCFPFAGGGPMLFRNWPAQLPDRVEMCGIRLPGRETRWREPSFTNLVALIETLATTLRPLFDKPFAFFGHSMGALIAHELARHLERAGGPAPRHLFVSGRQPSFLPLQRPAFHTLPEAEFREELRQLRGTPQEVIDNQELMDLLSPMLRADFALIETHQFQPGPPLVCPITVFGGLDDADVKLETLEEWRTLTRGTFQKHVLPGGHFFITSAEAALLPLLAATLGPLADLLKPAFNWPAADRFPSLQAQYVNLWSAPLEQDKATLDKFKDVLSDDERHRAARFYFDRDRQHFIAGRATLRALLGRYHGVEPAAIRFGYTDKGKPYLEEGDVRFNLAHSHGLALIAVTRGRDVGIDVEYMRPDVEAEALAASFFSPAEVNDFQAVSPERRQETFFTCWTRKEAYLKAIGKGLSLALSDFDVTVEPGNAALLATRHDPLEVGRWQLHELNPAKGYAAALAVERGDLNITCNTISLANWIWPI